MNLLDELTFLGKYIGSRLDLVQAGGGNISIKDGNNLFIKSSGCILSEMDQNYGYSVVDLNKANSFLKNLDSTSEESFGQSLNSLLSGNYKRPSIETPLHTIIEKNVVIHVHPIPALALTSQTDSFNSIQKLFPKSGWVNYVTPGKLLAESFMSTYSPELSIYFLENHGLVVAGDTYLEALELLENTIEKICEHLNIKLDLTSSEIFKKLHSEFDNYSCVYQNMNNHLLELFSTQKNTYTPICPDDVVYIGAEVLKLADIKSDEFKIFYKNHKLLPKVILYKNQLYFVDKNLIKAKQVYEQFYANIDASSYIKNKKPISQKDINFLSNWEAEKYRQQAKG